MLCSVLICNLLIAVSPLCASKIGIALKKLSRSGVSYPPSRGLSGNRNVYRPGHSYPHSTGLSGNNVGPRSSFNQKTQLHHHYYYNPPQRISYGAAQHPVYHGSPPIYVYEYKNSGSRYDNLLTGLALYNLGRMSARHDHGVNYGSRQGEICKLRIERNRVEYEETRIDCKLISSFNSKMPREPNSVIREVTSSRNVTRNVSENGTNSSMTVQSTTVAYAMNVKGPSVQVSPGMQCFVIRQSRYSTDLKRKVDCGLLQHYARESMYNGSNKFIPCVTVFFVIMLVM